MTPTTNEKEIVVWLAVLVFLFGGILYEVIFPALDEWWQTRKRVKGYREQERIYMSDAVRQQKLIDLNERRRRREQEIRESRVMWMDQGGNGAA